jgi:hypothetical protein
MKAVIALLWILASLIFVACEQPGKSDQAPKSEVGQAAQTETVQETATPAAEAVTGAAKEKTQ